MDVWCKREEAEEWAIDVNEEKKINLPRLNEILRLENLPVEGLAGEDEPLEQPKPESEEQINDDENDSQRLNRGEGRRKRNAVRILQLSHVDLGLLYQCIRWQTIHTAMMVDCYVKIEANRVNYIREHQTELHVAQYNGLFANQQISG
ncbi:hypothetical protein OUZ56_010319 [Daphnia magna]|uniref:Uncharacterized protein n=1 Tax=Daphnia magna TaxID=35525 RepID=A0ABR0AI72_9CRUS|nr:hypothetical protein OUZ56_010319 [Daphnia magna]